MTTIASSTTGLSLKPAATPERDKLKAAARRFEAIFVRQILAAARAAKPAGEDTLFGGQAMDTFASMQDERFADIAANTGAFGLAAAIERQLAAQVAPSPAASAQKGQ